MVKALYVLGAGGHSSVLVDILKGNGENIDAIYSPEQDISRLSLSDIKNCSDENALLEEDPSNIVLVNGIGSLPGNALRKVIFNKFSEQGFIFKKVISKHAIVSPYAILGEGVQVLAGAIIQAGAKVGDNSIINTGAIIEHDCIIGDHNHIAPGATLSGQVITGDNVHIGTGGVVIQSINIGSDTIIAAGAIVTQSIESQKIVFGARANIQDKKVRK